jgi:RNA polymerase sigma factor (sigma-70 family)
MEASPPYVRKVAERTVFDTIRRWRTQKRTARPEAWADLRRLCGKRIPTPEELFLIREEFGILVGWCRMQMSARLFHIFSLVHLKGASRQEVGHLVGLSRDGVDNALYKARRVLKERYERRSLSKVNPSEGK